MLPLEQCFKRDEEKKKPNSWYTKTFIGKKKKSFARLGRLLAKKLLYIAFGHRGQKFG